MNNKCLTFAILLLISTPSLAQVPSVEDRVRSEMVTLQVDRNNLDNALGELQKAIDDLLAKQREAERKANAMEAYLKACGDMPGCTQPIPEQKPTQQAPAEQK